MFQQVFLRYIAIFLLVAWGQAAHSEQNVNPGINDHYRDADYRQWVEVFERPGREIFDRRFRIMAAVGARPGMVVADIGAGTGLFTRLFARAVGPGGRVLAVDISRNFELFNDHKLYYEPEADTQDELNTVLYSFFMPEGERAAACIACAECPQAIKISEWMPTIHQTLTHQSVQAEAAES